MFWEYYDSSNESWGEKAERRKNHPWKIAGMESCLECSQNHIFEKLRHAVSYVWKNTNWCFPPFRNEHFYSAEIRDILRLLFTRYVDSLILDPLFTDTWEQKNGKKLSKMERIRNSGGLIWSHTIFRTIFTKIILVRRHFVWQLVLFSYSNLYKLWHRIFGAAAGFHFTT